MVRITILTVLLAIASPAVAQPGGQSRGGQSRGGQSRGGGSVPAVGTMLPTITAVDEQGHKFSTATLRGSYTVLVFGCLT